MNPGIPLRYYTNFCFPRTARMNGRTAGLFAVEKFKCRTNDGHSMASPQFGQTFSNAARMTTAAARSACSLETLQDALRKAHQRKVCLHCENHFQNHVIPTRERSEQERDLTSRLRSDAADGNATIVQQQFLSFRGKQRHVSHAFCEVEKPVVGPGKASPKRTRWARPAIEDGNCSKRWQLQ